MYRSSEQCIVMGGDYFEGQRCYQEWVVNGKFQHPDGNGRLCATADREDRFIVETAVTETESSLSTIRRTTHKRVFTMTIHRRLIERKFRTYRPLHQLPLTPAHCRAKLQLYFARSACQTLPWAARALYFSQVEHVWDTMERRLYLPGNADNLARQLEQI
ncbi:uncharacterized protein TNCV_1732281 [Trichonephila clavipes]|nr:uncharacterized protein TNCV_1732281 [Trichonephila clavipes]